MTKKHFIALADDIKWHNQRYILDRFTPEQLNTLAIFCKGQNSNFDHDLWMDYINGVCGPNGGPVKRS
jgi:hypothetical protein